MKTEEGTSRGSVPPLQYEPRSWSTAPPSLFLSSTSNWDCISTSLITGEVSCFTQIVLYYNRIAYLNPNWKVPSVNCKGFQLSMKCSSLSSIQQEPEKAKRPTCLQANVATSNKGDSLESILAANINRQTLNSNQTKKKIKNKTKYNISKWLFVNKRTKCPYDEWYERRTRRKK